jgi:hypothetical protein
MRRALTLAAALVLIACAAQASATTLPAQDWSAIRKVVGDQLTALKAGDGAKAMEFAAPGIREQFATPENFLRMVRTGYAPLLDARRTQFLEGAVIDGAVIQPLRLIMPDDSVLVALYRLQKQGDGQWRIAACVLAPSTVRST